MLELDDMARTRLLASGALTVDAGGDEVFVGLTVAESDFFLSFEPVAGNGHDSAENTLYLTLKHKHLVARHGALLAGCWQPTSAENEPPTG